MLAKNTKLNGAKIIKFFKIDAIAFFKTLSNTNQDSVKSTPNSLNLS